MIQVLNHDPQYGILVKRCFAFDDSDTSVQLVDDRYLQGPRNVLFELPCSELFHQGVITLFLLHWIYCKLFTSAPGKLYTSEQCT